MWGIIPAAGAGSRIQPLAFSKELLPVGTRLEGEVERPRAVSEYLVERMIVAGANKICFIISPGKSDILQYYGASVGSADLCYVVQPAAAGLCDAIFRVLPLLSPGEDVLVGLPDTIWYPASGFSSLPAGQFSFLLFPVERPEFFDAVITDEQGQVQEIQVKRADAGTSWIWGAFRLPADTLAELHRLWRAPERGDQYLGTLVNAYLAAGGKAIGVAAGEQYVDVGTVDGYRQATRLLATRAEQEAAAQELFSGENLPPRATWSAASNP